jgi:demethylmenaquinone methyltransferase / 2-methoxy-6-polyprenyl-1,4-benzoquinol methylase
MDNMKSDKKAAVTTMFNSIAGSYDFLNHFLSFGIDRMWRRRAIRIISGEFTNPEILDVATGTGDLSIAAIKAEPLRITGIDISDGMLDIGRNKIIRKGLSDRIRLIKGDSESLPFEDNTFDVAMVAFGVRNFEDPFKGLSEMKRVVRSGGMVLVLEFSKPVKFPFSQLYKFYFLKIVPLIGRLFSKNARAYKYLPESVMQFPDNERFMGLMIKAGLSSVKQKRISFGIASIYTGLK